MQLLQKKKKSMLQVQMIKKLGVSNFANTLKILANLLLTAFLFIEYVSLSQCYTLLYIGSVLFFLGCLKKTFLNSPRISRIYILLLRQFICT